MIRGISLLLATGLAVLWAFGLNRHATAWLTWLDGLGAVCGLLIASRGDASGRVGTAAAAIALAMGLGVLWVVALGRRAEAWLTWWTFAFACAYLILGMVAGLFAERRSIGGAQRLRRV